MKQLNHMLPKHKVDERLWDAIEDRLDPSRSVIDDLPVHSASPSLWEPISQSLSVLQQRKRRRILQYVSAISAAASIVLVVTFGVLRDTQPEESASVVIFSEEIVEETPVFAKVETTEDTDVMVYCNQFPDVCTTQEFSNLKTKWEKLKGELGRLKTLNEDSEDERIQMYISRIENDIQQLENRMMHMFM